MAWWEIHDSIVDWADDLIKQYPNILDRDWVDYDKEERLAIALAMQRQRDEAQAALAEKTAECERLKAICRSARHGISDNLEYMDPDETAVNFIGIMDDLKESDQ